MKKFKSLILLFAFVSVFVFVSCAISPDAKDFTYEISDPEFVDANRFLITVTMRNDTGNDYKYHGTYNDMHVASAKLYCETENGTYTLEHDPMPYTEDAPSDHVLKAGEEVKSYFYYNIPDDMVLGEYTFEFTGVDNNAYSKKIPISEQQSTNLLDNVVSVIPSDAVTEDFIIKEVNDNSFICSCVEHGGEIRTANWLSIKYHLSEGDVVTITHSGGIRESSPGQFSKVYKMSVTTKDGVVITVTEDELPPREPIQSYDINETLENDMVLSYTDDHYYEDEEFRYEITDFKSVTSDYFEFAITITNISGKDYEYFGTYNDERVTEVKVYAQSDDDELVLKHEEIALTCDDADNHVIKADASTKSYFRFDLPSDDSELDEMPLFSRMSPFSVEFDYFGKTITIKDALFSISAVHIDLSGGNN